LEPLLTIQGFGYRYPGQISPALSDVTLCVGAGECICLTGNSGSGKSTLLFAMMNLLRGGILSGTVTLVKQPASDSCDAPLGMVFQNPESQLFCTTVGEEVAFGPENLCVPAAEIGQRVAEALDAVGLPDQQERSLEAFSAGQKQRIAIASVLSLHPRLLLLDEPTSQLDAEGKQELVQVLSGLKRAGHTLVLAEHDPRPFLGLIDRFLVLDRGRVVAESGESPACIAPAVRRAPRAVTSPLTPAVLTATGLSLSFPEAGAVLRELQLEVRRQERVHLFGRNGAGKTTLLRCLAGLERPDSGNCRLAGIRQPRPESLPGKVGVLFQNPARQLFAETVWEEVAFTLRRMRLTGRELEERVVEALMVCGILRLTERAPLTLSFGEQHRVALAAVLAPRPELLLLDEPFAGLDFPQRLALLEILGTLPERFGSTVLIASHDELPDPNWADRRLVLEGGTLVAG
jgi:energy-coupling factor transport system ATP-binding protein